MTKQRLHKPSGSVELDIGRIDNIQNNNESREVEELSLDLNIEYVFNDCTNSLEIIETVEEFNDIKLDVLRCHYISILKNKNLLYLVTDNDRFYSINTSNISSKDISKMLTFNKPKKVIFNIKKYKDYLLESSIGFYDINLIFKLLWGLDGNNIRGVIKAVNMPEEIIENRYLLLRNLIQIAKALNIYIEKNKINKYIFLEMDVLTKATLLEVRGIPIDIEKYRKYRANIENKYDYLMENQLQIYGKDLDFGNVGSILKYLNDNKFINSLEESVLKAENAELYNNYKIYNIYNELSKHEFNGSNILLQYDTYKEFQVVTNFIPNYYFLDYQKLEFIEGSYCDLYLRVLIEISKCKKLQIGAASSNLIDFINVNVFEKKELGVFTKMIISAYANRMFDIDVIYKFILSKYNTSINVQDIQVINKLFLEKLPDLMLFFKNFNGSECDYERYHNKIFRTNVNLDCFIKQITNLIFKTAIDYVSSAINEYNSRYNSETNQLEVIGFYDNKIILSSSKGNSKIGIDILNRYMSLAYQKFIKKTKYFNITKVIEPNN